MCGAQLNAPHSRVSAQRLSPRPRDALQTASRGGGLHRLVLRDPGGDGRRRARGRGHRGPSRRRPGGGCPTSGIGGGGPDSAAVAVLAVAAAERTKAKLRHKSALLCD